MHYYIDITQDSIQNNNPSERSQSPCYKVNAGVITYTSLIATQQKHRFSLKPYFSPFLTLLYNSLQSVANQRIIK